MRHLMTAIQAGQKLGQLAARTRIPGLTGLSARILAPGLIVPTARNQVPGLNNLAARKNFSGLIRLSARITDTELNGLSAQPAFKRFLRGAVAFFLAALAGFVANRAGSDRLVCFRYSIA